MPSTSSSAHAEHAAVHAAGRTAVLRSEGATRVHLDRRRRRSGRRLLGSVDPLDRRCLRVEPARTRPGSGSRPARRRDDQEHRVGPLRGAQAVGDGGELGDAPAARTSASTSVITTAAVSSRVAATSSNADAGMAAGSGSASPSELGHPCRRDGSRRGVVHHDGRFRSSVPAIRPRLRCISIWPTLHRTGSVRGCRTDRSAPLLDDLVFTEGPRWREGRSWCSDMHDHRVISTALDGVADTVVRVDDDEPSGLGWLPDGRLLVVAMETPAAAARRARRRSGRARRPVVGRAWLAQRHDRRRRRHRLHR